jgi:hypothetical protein
MTQPYAGPSKSRPGQMTAVMRALPQATGPKVLRIGLVQAGRVIEERVVKQRTHVTVGPSEKNMFVVNAPGLPPTFRLFELVGTDKKRSEYHLNYLDGMTGRVALQTGIADLQGLKAQARRGPQGAYQVALTEEARGKVVMGDITFLFQFVAPPPVQPKPQLPMSVQSGISSQIDWRFTIIAAFSFLFHFGAVGMLYSDWMDPVVNEEVAIAGLLDSVRNIPPPPPIETPEVGTETNTGTTEVAAEAKGAGKGKGAGAAGGAGKGGGGISNAEFAGLSKELDQLEMATLGALTGGGTATAGVLGSGEVPTGALEAAAASGAGIGASGGSGLNIGGGGGGAIRPGAGGGGLAGIGQTGGGGPATAGTATKVEGPKPVVGASASVAGGSVGNAQAVVARMSAGFRRCYMQGLSVNPDMAGRVSVSARVGPGGEVQSVSATPSGSISSDVANCIAARVRSATFDPPEGGAATINIPVTLVQQK